MLLRFRKLFYTAFVSLYIIVWAKMLVYILTTKLFGSFLCVLVLCFTWICVYFHGRHVLIVSYTFLLVQYCHGHFKTLSSCEKAELFR